MFLPLRDINPTRRFPLVTVILIITNCLIFFYQIKVHGGLMTITKEYALIPHEIFNGNLSDSNLVNPYYNLITYMFLHGSFFHLLFNMLFLWIFGNNIEDVMTRPRFFMFYIISGIISGLAFALVYPDSKTFLVGASGAISAVLGAYLVLFPMAKLDVLIVIFTVRMPAMIFLPFWFFMQIMGFSSGGGNVAWISHISGFICGMLLYRFYLRRRVAY